MESNNCMTTFKIYNINENFYKTKYHIVSIVKNLKKTTRTNHVLQHLPLGLFLTYIKLD